MTSDERLKLRADYESWSGGFAPETNDDVVDYVSLSLPDEFDSDAARDWLLTQVGGWKA